ncbi:NAD-dependent epimerase/dehydratase family protein [Marinomonas pollencensis]|uniref:Uncharacterized protein YbjT (DUF2867 family) n=1 Tax=Marinomonas pollencensis TaxID=491954 RepID=A0A3E0DSS2_9GAMM|nr:NAD-dependent epimerase/dehydratase family protein [Marinomonas pollencensis]REG86597.1 uncharacterized protein YbjT (DUF2867 family) [Marinomonas pollencensis]
MGKTAVVIGATGLVGRALVDQLVGMASIDRVVTLTRCPAPHSAAKVDNHQVDFDHLEASENLFKADFLFSCLGSTLKQAGSLQAQRKVDLDYQLCAAKLALKQGVCHYLLVSSSGANAKSKSAYLAMKGELESKVKALPFSCISIFRPSLLLGEREEFRLAETLATYCLPILARVPGLKRYRPIRGSEVAQKMAQVSQLDNTGVIEYSLEAVFV